MTREFFEMSLGAKVGQPNPLRRAGAAIKSAQAALFLASDESSYLNGQAIAVDGGLSSTLPFAGGPLTGAAAVPRV